MKRLTPSIAAAIALLAMPASSAAAQTQRGAVLRVDRGHRLVEIVDAQHAVRSYAAPRGAARKLRAGAKVSFQASAGRSSDVLDGFEVDDQVDVTYYAEADGTLVADDIEPTDDDSGDE